MRIAITGAVARSIPAFSAACAPWFVCATTVRRGSAIAASTSRESSVEPSSTTMTSRSARVWARTLPTASPTQAAWL
jgi:hypothetical protein